MTGALRLMLYAEIARNSSHYCVTAGSLSYRSGVRNTGQVRRDLVSASVRGIPNEGYPRQSVVRAADTIPENERRWALDQAAGLVDALGLLLAESRVATPETV